MWNYECCMRSDAGRAVLADYQVCGQYFLLPRVNTSVFDIIVEYAECCFDISFEYVDPHNTIV
jgi:hypothetical protein